MSRNDPSRGRFERWSRPLLVLGAILVFAFFYIDDWGRDFSSHTAAVTEQAAIDGAAPLASRRPLEQLIVASQWAARRIGNWQYVGEAGTDGTIIVHFVRESRLLGIEDDILVRIEDRGDVRVVTATSEARSEFADLGRNPRNLRRFFREMQDVLDGATAHPAPFSTSPP